MTEELVISFSSDLPHLLFTLHVACPLLVAVLVSSQAYMQWEQELKDNLLTDDDVPGEDDVPRPGEHEDWGRVLAGLVVQLRGHLVSLPDLEPGHSPQPRDDLPPEQTEIMCQQQ